MQKQIVLLLLPAIFLLHAGCKGPAAERNFFNKKDLSGWKAAQGEYWSVQDSAIIGSSSSEIPKNQFIWSDVEVKDFYLSVDVKLDAPGANAGIQFRSKKIDDYGQALGYQADIGMNNGVNIWGTLYHEHGRGLLHTSVAGETTVKDKEWNHYEILASGDRIWTAVNGKIVSALRDPGGDTAGYIALQVHAGPPQKVRYRVKELIHNPGIRLAGKREEELNALLRRPLVAVAHNGPVNLKSGAVVAFAGGTNMANMLHDGYLETLLTAYYPTSSIKFRNLAWEGDQVDEQFRDVGFGDWKRNIDSMGASVVFVQFGQMEAIAGVEKLPAFIDSYKKLLASVKKPGRDIVILSPIDYENSFFKVNGVAQWNNPLAKNDLPLYFNAIQRMAQETGYAFVDLFQTLRPGRTYDGIHLNESGQKAVAEMVMNTLGLAMDYQEQLEPLMAQINEKNKIWFSYWRPANWAFLKGDRTEQAFSRHWKNGSERIFPEEMKQYAPLLDSAEQKIAIMQGLLAAGKKLNFTPAKPVTTSPVALNDSSVEQEFASFRIQKGFKIELFASEALGIAEPCAMRWDEKGRLWVLCTPAYPQPVPGQPANDRLVVLEDLDKDGKADSAVVFADGLHIPLGFELGHNGVYLGEQTRLLFLKDTNNDLRSDTRQTLMSGFGSHDSHQTINSFTWSPGGELFFGQGLSIHSYVETAWGVKKAHRGAIWRYRPAAHQLDPILDQSTASDNPWGITFGDYGELFTKSNDTGIYYTSPALVLSDHKALVPEIGATHIKSGIVEIPRSQHLPPDIRNDMLVAGYYNNKVERLKLVKSGAGYKATLMEPLLTSLSKNFRPVDIKTGPDGAIYVLDWYNPVIGHYQASLRDPQRDKTHGRVWRITASNRPLSKPPVLENQPVKVLLNALKSDEYWVRYQARRLIAARPAAEVIPALGQWVKAISGQNRERYLLAALAVYETFETVNERLLTQLLYAKNAGARRYAVQVAGRWCDRLPDPLTYIAPLINDKDASVRLMALVACSQVHVPAAMQVAAKMVNYPMDKFTSHAYEKVVFALQPSWEKAFRNQTITFNSSRQLASIISILKPAWYTAGMYRDLLKKGNYNAVVQTKLLSALTAVGSLEDIEYVISLPFTQTNAALLEEMARVEVKKATPAVAASTRQILQNARSEALIIAAMSLAKSWNIQELAPLVSSIISSPGQSERVIAQGITAVVGLKPEYGMALLEKFSLGKPSRLVRMAFINGYMKLNVNRGAAETVKEMKLGTGDVNEMRETLIAIIYEPGGLIALENEIRKQGLSANLAAAALVALDQRHISDKKLLKTISAYESKSADGVPALYNEVYVTQLAAKVEKADIKTGQSVYLNKLTCGSCHKVNNAGGNTGPELSAVGSGLTVPDIITEVLWPNKNIKEGYNSVRLMLKNGENIQGIKMWENAETIAVKSSPSSAPVTYTKVQINRVVGIGSVMPGGLTNNLNEQELAGLVKFLSTLRNK